MDVRVGDEHVLPGAVHFSSCVACGMCRCAGVACAVCGVQRKAHHAPLRELDLTLGQVGRPAARRVEAVPARVVQAVFGFECRDHHPCGRAAHGRLRINPAGASAEVGARLSWLTQHPAVVGHEDARAQHAAVRPIPSENSWARCPQFVDKSISASGDSGEFNLGLGTPSSTRAWPNAPLHPGRYRHRPQRVLHRLYSV